MKIAYLECASGISGNMLMGALIDAGIKPKALSKALKEISPVPFAIRSRRVTRGFMRCVYVKVNVVQERSSNFSAIEKRILKARLPEAVREKSLACFRVLAKAEAKVHGTKLSHVHFHEVGQTDAFVDIVGTILGFHWLGVEKIFCSPVNLGRGWVSFSHGKSPVPAPATAELLREFLVYQDEKDGELATPTGAALLKTLAEPITAMPEMQLKKVGYGAGEEKRSWPNVLRLYLGETRNAQGELIVQLTTVIDDMPPHLLAAQVEHIRKQALDVYLRPVVMKKGRLGTELVVLCSQEREKEVLEALFGTTTIGVRRQVIERLALQRKSLKFKSSLGEVHVKICRFGKTTKVVPELKDCLNIARQKKMPVQDVFQTVLREAMEKSAE